MSGMEAIMIAIFLGLVVIFLSIVFWRWIFIIIKKVFEMTTDLFWTSGESREKGKMAAAFFWVGIGMCVIAHFITTR